jgi:biotin transport system substrate-specific component
VPLALTNFFAVLGGLLLGPAWGSLSAAAYVGLGILGFPVFSNGRGGLAYMLGPTGGYLLGYIAGAFGAGLFAKKGSRLALLSGSMLGFLIVLALGICGLVLINRVPFARALVLGLIPFLPGDTIKTALAVFVAIKLRPFVDSLTGGTSANTNVE